MVDKTQAEDAPGEEQVVEEPSTEEKKPDAKPRAKRSDLDNLRSTKDREVAEANRGRTTAEKERDEARAELDSTREHLAVTRKSAGISDNEDERNRAFGEWQREASARDAKIHEHERTVTITHLAQVYGIPAEELEPFDNPLAMENAALKWRMNHQNEPADDTVEDQPDEAEKPSDEEDEPDTTRSRSVFDTGDGSGTTKSINDMTVKEREDLWNREQAKSRAKMFRAGR